MSAYVLLNLLSEFRETDKMWGCTEHLIIVFHNKFNIFYNS